MKIQITSHELEVLRKSAEGNTVQQIASDLNITPKDVAKCQKQILSITSTSNLMNALQELARKGFELRDPAARIKNLTS
jgi:DNA-binding NarL/FixJ family response regulator